MILRKKEAMAAFRLCNEQGHVIGAVILESKALEDEIINGQPDIRLGYTSTHTNIVNFTLEIIPPEK